MSKTLRSRRIGVAAAVAFVTALALTGLTSTGAMASAGAGSGTGVTAGLPPLTLPSIVWGWTNTGQTVSMSSMHRIVVDSSQASALTADANTFSADLATITGVSLPVVSASTAGPGDFYLTTSPTSSPTTGGYLAAINPSGSVLLSGQDAVGTFYAEQTVEQILARDPSHTTMTVGQLLDNPSDPHRGIMIDLGRHFWSVAELENEIRTMAWLKLNYLHLHFNDNDAFRLQSTTYPGLAPSGASYSHADIATLVAYAAKYHVTLVPEIDVPAHSAPILAYNPALAFKCSSMTKHRDQGNETLDVTNPATLTLVTKLIQEFAPLFPNSPVFHLGGDEYEELADLQACRDLVSYAQANHLGGPADVFVAFTNKLNAAVRATGKQMEIWNWWDQVGGNTISPDKNIIIDDWIGDSGATFAANGYEVVVSPFSWYVTPGEGHFPNDAEQYSSWTPSVASHVDGDELSLWADFEQTQPTSFFASYLLRPTEIFADRAWGGPRTASDSYSFEANADVIGAAPGLPSVTPLPGSNLTGTAYGSSPSFGNSANTFGTVFDGNVSTFFDYSQANGGYAGLDLGTAQQITKVRFVPRANNGSRMVGGTFQGCATGPNAGCVTLATVPNAPTNDWVELPVTNPARFRWVQYTGPAASYSNIAEAQFWGGPAELAPGIYDLQNSGSGLYADMPASSLASGTSLQQWTLNNPNPAGQAAPAGTPNQQWKFSLNADGSYTITNVNSGLCVTVAANSVVTGAQIQQQACAGTAFQRWSVGAASGTGGYTITSLGSGMSLTSAGLGLRSQLVQAVPSSTSMQSWSIAAPVILPGTYNLSNTGSGFYADMAGASRLPGAFADLWTLNTPPTATGPYGTANQQWNFVPNSDGSYTIRSTDKSFCLMVTDGSNAAGAPISQQNCFDTVYENWRVSAAATGSGYTITSVGSGLALSAPSGSSAPNGTLGLQLVQSALSNDALQNWTINSVS